MEKEQEKTTLSDEEVEKIIESIDRVDAVDDFDPADLLGVAMELYIQDSGFDVQSSQSVIEIDEIKKDDIKSTPGIIKKEQEKSTVTEIDVEKSQSAQEKTEIDEEKPSDIQALVEKEIEKEEEIQEKAEETEEEVDEDDYFQVAIDLFESPMFVEDEEEEEEEEEIEEEEEEEPEPEKAKIPETKEPKAKKAIEKKETTTQDPVAEVDVKPKKKTVRKKEQKASKKTAPLKEKEASPKQITTPKSPGESGTGLQTKPPGKTKSPVKEEPTKRKGIDISFMERDTIEEDEEIGSGLVFLSPEMLQAIEGTATKAGKEVSEEVAIPVEEKIQEVKRDWETLIEEKEEEEVETDKKAIIEEEEDETDEETLVEEEEEEPEAETEELTKDKYLSPDDWMAIMEGKEVVMADGEEVVLNAEDLEYMLKEAPDYTERHVVPERQTPREVEKPPPRKGLRKKEIFLQTKLAFKQRFGASVKTPGKICSACGKGEKAKQCVVCGADGASIMTRLCEKCAGDKKTVNNCISCGRPNAKIIAKLCDKCKNRAMTCFRCGAKL